MKTFTLNELRTNYNLFRTVKIVELSSGGFVLESHQRAITRTFATIEEAEAALQTELGLHGLTDLRIVRTLAEPGFDECGRLVWKESKQKFAFVGYQVARLEQEFSTRDEVDAVLKQAAESCVEALYQELTHASELPVLEVIKTEGGQVTVREGPNIGCWYTFTDPNGEQCSTNNLSMWMQFGMPKLSVSQGN